MNIDAKRIIDFWYNRPPLQWIVAPDGLGHTIKSEFGHLVVKAQNRELQSWAEDPEASLALIALLYQFPRNLHRGTPEAFGTDDQAWEAAQNAVARDFDKQVTVIQASAYYIALMHKENLMSMIAARCLFEALKPRCTTEEERKWVDMGVTATARHMDQLREKV
ncbi:hypothetical protein N3K66_006357 [Trichothecium roseum]|uniref:Uncharacterized protein n=1 Tax=Trichothecium roseum TaxID=47278 RepID=A0ACC0UV53_9HYPO|nr:hypothetical protein N3K66_006357 [Trichothecium roseum]